MSATSATDPVARAYFDTSALVKRYVTERGSLAVRRLLRRRRVVSSAVLHLEVLSAVRRRYAEAAIVRTDYARLLRQIEVDAAQWDLLTISAEILALARSRLLQSGLRTLDAIHIASAETVYRERERIPFVTADARQAAGARAAGLDVLHVGD